MMSPRWFTTQMRKSTWQLPGHPSAIVKQKCSKSIMTPRVDWGWAGTVFSPSCDVVFEYSKKGDRRVSETAR